MLLLIILVGRLEGIRTACAMLISAAVIYFFMLPLISGGANAVFIVTLTSGVVAFVSLVFVIGPSRKTFSAVLGTNGRHLGCGFDCAVCAAAPPFFWVRERDFGGHRRGNAHTAFDFVPDPLG